MSHAGPPPPDEPDPSPDQPAQPPAYNPYPDNWETAPTGAPAFHAGPPPGSSNPYGQPAPYGQTAASNPYAGPDTARPTFAFGGYAGWFTRVGAYLIDSVAASLAAAPLWAGWVMRLRDTHVVHQTDGSVVLQQSGTSAGAGFLILVGTLTGLAFLIWNVGLRQGRTGASIGKSVLAIRLVNADLQPIGPGWALLRQLLHVLDGLPCACLPLGYLWPIWDERKQTFADKLMRSFVIQATTEVGRPFAP
jgi:uncharacterized RDD family membrane protein YckC